MERKNPRCSQYDLRALENWLAEMAADGWVLAGEWPYFEKAEETQERRFAIEPAAEKDGVPKALLDSRAMMGWEYVCAMDKSAFYVWRSVDKTAQAPRARELAGSWCDKRLTRHLRNWWLGILVLFILYAFWGAYAFRNAEMPLWRTLTDGNAQWTICSMLLTVFCGLWATRREHRDLRRLRKAVRAGEYQEPVAQHAAWYEVMQWLPMVAATAALLTTCAAARAGSRIAQEELAAYPMLHAETFGGVGEDQLGSRYDTALCDTIVVCEGDWVDTLDHYRWTVYATQLEVYKLRVGALAKPLAEELREYYSMEQVKTLNSIDEACYCPSYKGAQFFLLRDGGIVLLYRTDAPDDLRRYSDEFTALLETYRDVLLTR